MVFEAGADDVTRVSPQVTGHSCTLICLSVSTGWTHGRFARFGFGSFLLRVIANLTILAGTYTQETTQNCQSSVFSLHQLASAPRLGPSTLSGLYRPDRTAPRSPLFERSHALGRLGTAAWREFARFEPRRGRMQFGTFSDVHGTSCIRKTYIFVSQ